MKVMNEIKAELKGTIAAIVADDGTPVQFGEPSSDHAPRPNQGPPNPQTPIPMFNVKSSSPTAARSPCASSAPAASSASRSVAVYSEADVDSMHVQLADEAVCIGPAASKESYLKIDRIIAAAEITDVDAIHPGYGFLSENAAFAEICESCKIKFIGPSADVIRMMGDKTTARATAQRHRRAHHPRLRRHRRRRGRSAARGRRRNRLPGHDQGHRRRRRQGHAPGPQRGRTSVACFHAASQRGRKALRQRRRATSRNSSSTRTTSSSRSSPTATATSSTSASATARCSAATRRSSRNARRRLLRPPKLRERMGDASVQPGQGDRLRERRHHRVPRRRRRRTSTSWR